MSKRGVSGVWAAGLLCLGSVGLADDGLVVPASAAGVSAAGVAVGVEDAGVSGESRVSVDSLFAPIGSLRLQPPAVTGGAAETVVKSPALDELISQKLAADNAAAYFGEQRMVPAGLRSRPLSVGRNPYAFRHQPLYFAQPALEVSGQSMVGLNPFISVGWFAVDAALLPVRLVTQPPCSKVCSGQ